jgi:hypothetical protein
MDIYIALRDLAKSVESQNLFLASKEINGIYLFKNNFNFSKIQTIYLSYLYNYDSINRDIIIEKISKHVLDNYIYEDSYLLYRRKNKNPKAKPDKPNEVSLVLDEKIIFPKRT